MNFFTSDLHINHKNVINYCNRPFQTVEEMNFGIISLWNEQINPEDHVYVLGDFSLNPKWSGIVLPQLNGTKSLISGNHDATWRHCHRKKGEKMYARYLADGWKEICDTKEMHLSDGTFVLLSHLPYASKEGNQYDQRYLENKPEDKGAILLHGHVHGRYKKFGRMIDVGWDAHAGKILSENDIIELIKDPREFIDAPLTEWYKNRTERPG